MSTFWKTAGLILFTFNHLQSQWTQIIFCKSGNPKRNGIRIIEPSRRSITKYIFPKIKLSLNFNRCRYLIHNSRRLWSVKYIWRSMCNVFASIFQTCGVTLLCNPSIKNLITWTVCSRLYSHIVSREADVLKKHMPPSSGSKSEPPKHQGSLWTTQCHNPEDHTFHSHCHENFKFTSLLVTAAVQWVAPLTFRRSQVRSQPRSWPSWQGFGVPFIPENARTVPSVRPWLLPSSYFAIHYSLMIPSFDTT
jgi:hypothetical protein